MSLVKLSNGSFHAGNLILVNQSYSCQNNTERSLVPVIDQNESVLLNRAAVVLLSSLMEKIHGWKNIVPVSGWRPVQEQQKIWDDTMAESGEEFTKKFVAVPGHSEHQTGLAIDLALESKQIDFICPDFPYTGICQIFRRKATSYGFIERYPSGKEAITGIGHEPWHFRYVGVPHADIMDELNMTLEEYIPFLKKYPYGQLPFRYKKNGIVVDISYLPADFAGETKIDINTELPYSISGNNVDGFIITEWRNADDGQKRLQRA
ncbi:MAG: M15 family metallopeptidase [Oscillospiraceae bacterium]|nr:M15 family metallopeptidase [Oscillospiraceae bacterium]